MSEQEKKWERIYDLLDTKTKPQKISEIIGVSLWLPSSPDFNPLDYAIWSILENKTNATSHPNIEEEWNKMSEEFKDMQIISKVCWFNNWKKKKKMAAILSKFTVLCLSPYFVVYFLKLRLILFYNSCLSLY